MRHQLEVPDGRFWCTLQECCFSLGTTRQATPWPGHCELPTPVLSSLVFLLPAMPFRAAVYLHPLQADDTVQTSSETPAAASLAPCRFHIATNPAVEAKVIAELAAEGLLAMPEAPQPRPLQHDDLSKLTYLGAAIKVRTVEYVESMSGCESIQSLVLQGVRIGCQQYCNCGPCWSRHRGVDAFIALCGGIE